MYIRYLFSVHIYRTILTMIFQIGSAGTTFGFTGDSNVEASSSGHQETYFEGTLVLWTTVALQNHANKSTNTPTRPTSVN